MNPSTEEDTVILLPQSTENILCFEFRNKITLKDHDILTRNVGKAVEHYGECSLLFYYAPSFSGWEPAAADDNMKAILDFGKLTKKLAYVNPPEKKIMQHKITPDLFGGELRYFSADQLEEAIAWVND